MARKSKTGKDRTGVAIAVGLHIVIIAGVGIWAWKTGKVQEAFRHIMGVVTPEKKVEKKQEPAPTTQQPKLPPINTGVTAPTSSGTRRATAADAPASSGNTFFEDTRPVGTGASTGGTGGGTAKPTTVVPVRAPPPPPPRVIFAPPPKTTIKQLMAERSQAAASIESFGSEQISRSSVKDAGDIVSKVSGATVVEGKYAVIRGLTDRYSGVTLNGAELPSADPYRRSAALDMFPAKIIDRVTVTKTFTPDQPGSFTGGNINVVTKSFPDKPFAAVEIGMGYNTQATGNGHFLTYNGGKTDWMAMDDGTRGLDDTFWNPAFRPPSVNPGGIFNTNTPAGRASLANARELDRLTRLAGPAEFRPTRKAPPPNHNFVASAGDTAFVLGRPVGIFLSLPYNRSYGFYNNGVVTRVSYNRPGDPMVVQEEKHFDEAKGTEEVNWAGTATLAYQLFPDHQLGYNFIFNQYSEDTARIRSGVDFDNGLTGIEQNRLQFIERNLTAHQFRGNHVFPDAGGFTVDWLATFTQTSQDEPDNRFYYMNNGSFNWSGLDPKFPKRYWRELQEENQNLRLDFTQPFHLFPPEEARLKFGLFSSASERHYRERSLIYNTPGANNFSGDPNDFLTQDRIGVGSYVTNGANVRANWLNFLANPADFSFYDGENKIRAAYAMIDFPVFENVRLIGGARYEQTKITLKAFTTAISEGLTPGTTNSSSLSQEDILPAAGIVWSLRTNMNVRLNYGETLARPSFRELAPVRTFDVQTDENIVGNPGLTITAIKNYDARWEWFPRPGEILSAGVFYKELKGAIEKEFVSATGDIVTFKNREDAKVYGLELEARKILDFAGYHFRDWSIGGNFSLIKSEQKVAALDLANHTRPDLLGTVRPLADQSPYIINLDLTYDNPRTGSTLSMNYNIFGPRLVIANLAAPDIYDQPSEQLDITFSQVIGRRLRAKIAARNILDPEIKRTYGKDDLAVYSSYTRGRTFSFSLTYDF